MRGALSLAILTLLACEQRGGVQDAAPRGAAQDAAPSVPRGPDAAPAAPDAAGPAGATVLAVIKAALRGNGISADQLPIYLAFAHLESNFDPHAVSPMGAAGLFQLMPGTALSIADNHPHTAPEQVTIYNPRWRSGRRLLFAGAAGRYAPRVLRGYAAHLRRFARRNAGESATDRAARLVATDSRFDPLVNARLATYHVERLRRSYFGRRRCFRSGSRKICGRFGGRHGTMMAAACFHLGTPAVTRAIAETGARSFKAYIRGALRSDKRSRRDNGRYLRRLWRLTRTYRRLAAGGGPRRADVAGAFRDPSIARNLFRTHPVKLPGG